jgi:hypothetical protein
MLYWAVVFLVIALVAALFGFGGIAVAAAGIAQTSPKHPGSSSFLVRATWTSCVHTWACLTLLDIAAHGLCRACLALAGLIVLIPDGQIFPLTSACARARLTGDRMVSADGSPLHSVVARGG